MSCRAALALQCGAQQQRAVLQRPSTARPLRLHQRAAVAAPSRRSGLQVVALFGKGDGEKEDAARKALQDAFKGKKDPFAAAEKAKKRDGGGFGGGGSGGGGGGGGGSGGFDFSEFGDNFKKGLSNLLKTIATILLFAGALGAMTLWRPLLSLLGSLVRTVLRLDGNPQAQLGKGGPPPQADLSKKEGLGNVEEAVISKYAAADDDDEEGEDEA